MLIGICIGEQILNDEIEKLLLRFNKSGRFLVYKFCRGEDLIAKYKSGVRFDILLIDIKLKSLNGIETARAIRAYDQNVLIIFISNVPDYCLQGYEVRAFDYLVKPLTVEKLTHTLLKALHEINAKKSDTYSICVKDKGMLLLDVNDIVYLESMGRKITLHLVNREFEFYSKISDEEKTLAKYNFLRVHRSYLVNMKYIDRIFSGYLVLKNDIKLPVSHKQYKFIYSKFRQYLLG